jgi:Formate hydrogenlyase subunit 3/Multisubunit Na+/H+ antiporter, MnhD subunit
LPDGTYILTVLPLAIILILLKYLNGFAWLRESQLVYQALFLFGAVMTLTGSVWSVFQNRIKKKIGYLTIYFNGLLLSALGLNSSQGYLIFSEALLPRLLSMFLVMTSLLIIRDRYQLENLADLRSLFYEYPFSSMGFLISLFTMIGMPLSNGFLPLQSLYQATALNHLPILIIMLCGTGILTFSFIRLFMVIMLPIEDDYEIVTQKESRIEKIVIAVLVILNVLSDYYQK